MRWVDTFCDCVDAAFTEKWEGLGGDAEAPIIHVRGGSGTLPRESMGYLLRRRFANDAPETSRVFWFMQFTCDRIRV